MAHSATTIANFFLDKASKEGRALTPMQLLKLVYIAHGWHLGYFQEPLIDEPVQAWKYGPVIPSLYDKVKKYGSGAVRGPVKQAFPWSRDPQLNEQALSLLESVWKGYSRFSGLQLSNMTHQADTPWHEAWRERGGHAARHTQIDNSIIERHYTQKIKVLRAKRPDAA